MASFIELRHLRTIVALRDTGSLVEAAERVFLTHSSLSHQLKDLEGRLPELHRHLEKLMGDLGPDERRQVERAMKALEGALGEAQGEKRSKRAKRAKKSKKSKN